MVGILKKKYGIVTSYKMDNTFSIINGEYINLYDEEKNIMLKKDDECYFLVNNVDDIYFPMICHGIIEDDIFIDGLNKQYIISLKEIHEDDDIIQKYFYNNIFRMCRRDKQDNFTRGDGVLIKNSNFGEIIKTRFFRIDAFFVRKDFELILKLKYGYLDYIREKLVNDITIVNEILENMESKFVSILK